MLGKYKSRCFLFLILLMVFANRADAQLIYVQPGESIQDAIELAVSGDTVFLYAGIYQQDVVIENKNGLTLEGEAYYNVTLEGTIILKDADTSIENITIYYGEGPIPSYSNSYYTDWELYADVGITAINSDTTVRNCIIQPHPDYLTLQNLTYYGKAIQIWNVYNNPDIAPQIEDNIIQDADCGIYYFSQAFGGAVNGRINDNIFYNNRHGIILRMHKENPHVYNNIFTSCLSTGISYTYEDGSLFTNRQLNLNNNLFYGNNIDGWVDAGEETFNIVGLRDNITGDPLFIDPANDVFYLSSGDSPCIGMGEGGTDIGTYSADLQYPTIENILPAENRLVGQLNVDISGTVFDDNGIMYVFINSDPAIVIDTTFSKEDYPLTFGLNNLSIKATDLAKKETSVPKPIYVFRSPVEPPQ